MKKGLEALPRSIRLTLDSPPKLLGRAVDPGGTAPNAAPALVAIPEDLILRIGSEAASKLGPEGSFLAITPHTAREAGRRLGEDETVSCAGFPVPAGGA